MVDLGDLPNIKAQHDAFKQQGSRMKYHPNSVNRKERGI